MADILARLEQENRERTERVREIIRESGRDDVLAEFDASLWRLNSGVERARNVWHSISPAQRRALGLLGAAHGQRAYREEIRARYLCPFGSIVCRSAKTMRSLQRRQLVEWWGEWGDPSRIAVLTGLGRFTLKYGPQANGPSTAPAEE